MSNWDLSPQLKPQETNVSSGSSSSSCLLLRAVWGLRGPQGCLGPQHPWPAGGGGSSQQETVSWEGWARVGWCRLSLWPVQTTGSSPAPGERQPQGASQRGWCKQGRRRLGAVSAVCEAVHVAGHMGRPASSAKWPGCCLLCWPAGLGCNPNGHPN